MSVAIVHDYLNQPGGAERTVLEIASLWPGAPIYTSLYRPESTFPEFRDHEIRTSFLDRLPVDQRFRAMLPLYPAAIRSLGVLGQDLVISSSSGFAHGVRTSNNSVHIVYCYAPPRWLYPSQYFSHPAVRAAFSPAAVMLRAWDSRAAQRADAYITIADNVRQRVLEAYGIESEVVYPPVDTERFNPMPRGDRLLVVSRLLSYKRVDLIVRAASQIGVPLDIVGTGPDMNRLRGLAGPNVNFHGRIDDLGVKQMIEHCNAVCFPGEEDFGIVPVEANAAGKPVIAYAAGGALETLQDGHSAVFFKEQTAESVIAAIKRAVRLDTDPAQLAAGAKRFSKAAFRRNFIAAIERLGHKSHS